MQCRVLTALLTVFGFCAVAYADDGLTLSRGTWSAQTYAAYGAESHEKLLNGNFGIGYYFIDNLSFSLEVAGYDVLQEGPDAYAGELRLMMRHHLIVRDRWSIFADVGQGVIESSDRVPPGGTRFNFIFRAGLGATWELRDNMHLIGGVHYVHLSNAQIEGSDRNPSINGIEGYVGLMWTWR